MMPLDDITIVYRSLQPDTPLPPNDPRYVPLAEARGEPEGGWRKKLERQLRFADTARTFLISGFIGDGKSTELLRLQEDLKTTDPKLAVVYVNCKDYLNVYQYSFNEVLLAVISETGRQLREPPYEVELRPGYFSRKLQELKGVFLSEAELHELSLKAGSKGTGIEFEAAAKIALKARDSDSWRKQLWDLLRGDRTSLVEEFGKLINTDVRPTLRKKGFGDLVIIIDWLEKLEPTPGHSAGEPNLQEQLFLHHASQFQSFGAHLVMTLPIAMAYSAVEGRLTLAYGRPPVVIGAVRVADSFPDNERREGREALCEMLQKRFEHAPEGSVKFGSVFSDRKLAEELIVFSGGHPRGLLILISECLCAWTNSPSHARRSNRQRRVRFTPLRGRSRKAGFPNSRQFIGLAKLRPIPIIWRCC